MGSYIILIYYITSDLTTSREITLGTFADDTALFATHEDPTIAPLNVQEHLHNIEKWLNKWKIKNKSKSSHITFTLRKGHCPTVPLSHCPTVPLSHSQHQPNYHTTNRSSKIPGTTLRLRVKLERTHRQKKKTTYLSTKR